MRADGLRSVYREWAPMTTRMILLFAAAAFLASCRAQTPLLVPVSVLDSDNVVPGWMSLSDGTFHTEAEDFPPSGYYVKGVRRPWDAFHPRSAILGMARSKAPSETRCEAWLELDDGSIHPAQEAMAPRPPYVRGYVDEAGRFHPDPVEIVQ